MNDAYFTLSDASRRREYDSQRKLFGGGSSSSRRPADPFAEFEEEEEEANATGGGAGAGAQSAFSWAWNYFTQQNQQGQGQNAGGAQQQQQTRQEADNAQFGDVFEEMLREEGMANPNGTANGQFWSMLGGASGGALGFIVANVPGLVAGAVAGNRLGAVRDAKGKSVYAVFQVSIPYNHLQGVSQERLCSSYHVELQADS